MATTLTVALIWVQRLVGDQHPTQGQAVVLMVALAQAWIQNLLAGKCRPWAVVDWLEWWEFNFF